MKILAAAVLLLAVSLFVVGLVIHLTGNEVAILALIVAFGLFTFGIGVAAVSFRR